MRTKLEAKTEQGIKAPYAFLPVTAVSTEPSYGYVTPITSSGTLLVDGVGACCFYRIGSEHQRRVGDFLYTNNFLKITFVLKKS